MNNLLERLHASFFFYILTSPGTFLKIGYYLPSVIMISVALMFTGLREWTSAGWTKVRVEPEPASEKLSEDDRQAGVEAIKEDWERRPRPVLRALLLMLLTHVSGAALFLLHQKGWVSPFALFKPNTSSLFRFALSISTHLTVLIGQWFSLQPIFAFFAHEPPFSAAPAPAPTSPFDPAPISSVLKAFNLFVASTLISVTSLLNFWLAALLCVVLGLPLTFLSVSASNTYTTKVIKAILLLECTMLLYNSTVTNSTLWNWSVLGVWFAPLMSVICVPILFQASLACALL